MRVRESKRAAEQAEQVARDLRQRANEAQQDADRAQNTAQGLSVKAVRAEAHAGQVRAGSAVVESTGTTPATQIGQVKPVSTAFSADASSANEAGSVTTGSSTGVLGLGGQRLGQLINFLA